MASLVAAHDPYHSNTGPIPHAEVWTPTRPMLSSSLPIPPTDSGSLTRLARTAQRRRETTAMRQLWKASREDNRGPSSVLGNYKKMLQAQEHNSNYVNEDNSMHHINTDHHKQDVLLPLSPMPSPPQTAQITKPVRTRPPRQAGSGIHAIQPHKTNDNNKMAEGGRSKTCLADKRHISSYSIDYVQTLGMCSLPRIPIRTLSADWWNQVQRRPSTRMRYSEPIVVTTDRDKIKRQIRGKFFIKNSTQTYFQSTVPKHLHTYNIHPEFDSEHQRCWSSAAHSHT